MELSDHTSYSFRGFSPFFLKICSLEIGEIALTELGECYAMKKKKLLIFEHMTWY